MLIILVEEYNTKKIAIIYLISMFPSALLLEWLFQGLNKMKLLSIGRIIGISAYLFIIIGKVLINLCEKENFKSIFPPINLCGDNAAMIAMVGLEKFKLKQFSDLDHPAIPRWPLDKDAIFLKGAGVRL